MLYSRNCDSSRDPDSLDKCLLLNKNFDRGCENVFIGVCEYSILRKCTLLGRASKGRGSLDRSVGHTIIIANATRETVFEDMIPARDHKILRE